MAQIKDSRVQFFNSQSSFGSSSLISNSRFQFANDELLNDTQQIFSTLTTVLIPREDLVNKMQLGHIVHRARILVKQTMPQHIARIGKNQKNSQLTRIVYKCQQRLTKLVNDYDKYNSSALSYQDFFQTYGRQNDNQIKDFSKKRQLQAQVVYMNIEPDVVNIIQATPHKVYRHALHTPVISQRAQKDRQLLSIQDQLINLKKRQNNIISQYQASEKSLKKQTAERVHRIIKTQSQSHPQSQTVKVLKYQLLKNKQLIQQEYLNNNAAQQRIVQLSEQLQLVQQKYRILQAELEESRRVGQSRASQDINRSRYSQDNIQNQNNNVKRLKKIIKNLQYQNNLIKNQLKRQRQNVYKQKKLKIAEEQSQIARLRKALQNKNKQLIQTRSQLDLYKIQSIKLADQLQNSQKSVQLAKLQINRLPPANSPPNSYSASNGFGSHQHSEKDHAGLIKLSQSRGTKLSIHNYVGDGNQNYPYYQFLNKQFKIRFRRACLKDKQLLYKSNGLEIGVISQFYQPNEIRLILHLSNFCDQQNIKNLKIKANNTKNNRITTQNCQWQILEIGKQVKTIITANIKNYPIGCTALLCQYQYYDKQQQIRILLPFHIFKMLTFRPRDDEFRSPQTVMLQTQRKISKDAQSLLSYMKGAKTIGKNNNILSSTIFHQQSQTKMLCDVQFKNNGQVNIKYEHRTGQQAISQYVIKTLSFLIRKQQGI